MKLAQKNLEEDPGAISQLYEAIVISKIRKQYTVNQELAILRQKDSKPEEFAEYDDFVEQCKAEAKAELGI
ncbi:MAG: hypothetical protein IKY65_04495 [Rikenellaceae bacterium]|nr:hypothetical protein [Rikenellaceae bacterium]